MHIDTVLSSRLKSFLDHHTIRTRLRERLMAYQQENWIGWHGMSAYPEQNCYARHTALSG